MSWLEIADFLVIVALFQSITAVSGQITFLDDDNPNDFQRRQFPRAPQQQQLFANQQSGNQRPISTSSPGTTTTAQPAQVTQCRENCPITSEYNPVCGSDGQSYNNMSVLRCARECGINVQFRRIGPCAPRG